MTARTVLARLPYRNELAAIALLLLVPPALLRDIPSGVYVSGVIVGCALALHAIGIVLVHQANRFLNLAQVALGATVAWAFGISVTYLPSRRWIGNVCPPCAPDPTPGFYNVNYVFSIVAAMGLSILLSWLLYVVVVRRFASAPRLVVTVATTFVAGALPALSNIVGYFLTTPVQRETQLPGAFSVLPPFDVELRVAGITFHLADVLLVVVATTAVIGLHVYQRFSRTGIAMRAAAENPSRAETLGVNVGRVTTRVWLVVGFLSGAAALLGVMGGTAGGAGTGSDVLGVDVLVLILAAAVVGRLRNLPLAVAAAIALGVARQAVSYHYGSTLPLDAFVVVIVTGLLVAQRRETGRAVQDATAWLAAREARPIPHELRQLPAVRSGLRWLGGALAVVLLGFPWVMSPAQTGLGAATFAFAIVGLSLLILTGWAGQVSLGQFAFAAVGAWVAAVTGLPFVLALIVGGLAGGAVAVAVGVPALKLRGLHLAVSTLALAVSTTAVLLNERYLGDALPVRVDRPELLGVDFDASRAFYYLSLAILVVAVVAVVGLRQSRTGRALIAARDNEAAVEMLGVSILRLRLTAFAISGFLAALAGALYAYQQTGVRANAYGPDQSITMFLLTVIGGLGAVSGPLVGAAYYGALSIFGASPVVRGMATGLGGLLVLLLAPGGLTKVAFDLRDAFLRRVASRNRLVVASLTADRLASDVDAAAPIAPTRSGAVPVRYRLRNQWSVGLAGRLADPGAVVRAVEDDAGLDDFRGLEATVDG